MSDNTQSLYTANTGFNVVDTANPNLNGKYGDYVTILSSGTHGTLIKSVIIKCISPTPFGMVRLFIGNTVGEEGILIREIPIPVYPQSPTTPIPAPIWPMLEIDLPLNLYLESSTTLIASTQTATSFNVIAQGLNLSFPADQPTTCCYDKELTPTVGRGIIGVANENTDGSGDITKILAAGSTSNGTTITSITIAALQSTTKGMVRLFLSKDDGQTYLLWMEIVIPDSNQSAYQPSFKTVINENFDLQASYCIGASTQNAEAFAITIEGQNWTYPFF